MATPETNSELDNEAYARLKVARHPERPYTLDYIGKLCENFTELHGDRRFADDAALIAGFATFEGVPIAVVGQQKGRSTNERRQRNFGMPKPEGYRKALRVMKLAEKFGRAIVCLIDTPGAYPGVDAEEHGQSEAIARNLIEMSALRVPVVAVIIGEGGSGGALALGVCDCALMLENAIYSVITPEGCAAILWKDSGQAPLAAKLLRFTAQDLQKLQLIDGIVPEPTGGAHADQEQALILVGTEINKKLQELSAMTIDNLMTKRHKKLRKLGLGVAI
ncbi:MAG: acetyl-CoA carboxylase carboxyltransferase subunit alpha [Pyrinomonadaceae bacterium]